MAEGLVASVELHIVVTYLQGELLNEEGCRNQSR